MGAGQRPAAVPDEIGGCGQAGEEARRTSEVGTVMDERRPAGDHVAEQPDHLLADPVQRMPDRGQRRVERGGQAGVVEADDPDVAGHVAGRPRAAPAGSPAAIASEAANTASRSGARSSSARMPAAPLSRLQSPCTIRAGSTGDAVRGQRVGVALQPVHPAGGVLRPGDRGDPPAAGRDQVLDRRPGAGPVVGRHRADHLLVAEHPAAGHDRHLGLPPAGRAAGRRSAARPAARRRRGRRTGRPPCGCRSSGVAGDHQDQGELAVGQRLGDAAQQHREVRVLEQQVLRLGEQERDRPGLAGGQRPGVRVGGVAGPGDRLADRADAPRG